VLLAIDIGNSQIDLGLFRGKRLIKSSFFPKEDQEEDQEPEEPRNNP